MENEVRFNTPPSSLLTLFCCGRYMCVHQFPHSLPKLLQSIAWNNKGDVSQVPPPPSHCCCLMHPPPPPLDVCAALRMEEAESRSGNGAAGLPVC